MLYTYIPEEQIFGAASASNSDTGDNKIKAVYMGEVVLVTLCGDGTYCLDRLISTNPASYLKKEFLPGTVLPEKSIKL